MKQRQFFLLQPIKTQLPVVLTCLTVQMFMHLESGRKNRSIAPKSSDRTGAHRFKSADVFASKRNELSATEQVDFIYESVF